MNLSAIGKLLAIVGLGVALIGGVLVLAGKGVLARLPGNLSLGRGNVRVFIPLGTSILLSLILTLVLNLFLRR